jgi:hypothetical protein
MDDRVATNLLREVVASLDPTTAALVRHRIGRQQLLELMQQAAVNVANTPPADDTCRSEQTIQELRRLILIELAAPTNPIEAVPSPTRTRRRWRLRRRPRAS